MPSVIPYTLIFMLPTNDRLAEKATAKYDASSSSETSQLIQRWTALNHGRAVLVGLGAMLGAAAAIAT